MKNQSQISDHDKLSEQLDKLSLSHCTCKNKQTEDAFNSAIMHAVKNNCLFCVKNLAHQVAINHNFAPSHQLPRTYLFIACENGCKEIIEYLLEKKAQT